MTLTHVPTITQPQIFILQILDLDLQPLILLPHFPLVAMPAKRPGPHAKDDAQNKNADRKGREERQNTLQKSLVTHFVPLKNY